MTVVYLVADLEFASREEKLRHRAHFGVLQQYARSGKIDELIVLSNKLLLELAGSGPIRKYYEKVNYYIYSAFQNINFCENVDQDFGKLHKPKDISRISTIGWSSMFGEEQILFPLENITESCYYMNIDETDLDSNEDVLPNCQKIVRNNNNLERHSSFAIWRNSETKNYFYIKHYTHYIQKKKKTKKKKKKKKKKLNKKKKRLNKFPHTPPKKKKKKKKKKYIFFFFVYKKKKKLRK